MSRTKKVRRFEPRFGVSRLAVETEAKEVARELESYLLLSLSDLRDKLKDRQDKWTRSDDGMKAILRKLPERHRLAFQCMLFRDFYHILELYAECSRDVRAEGPKGEHPSQEVPLTPFSEWLFGST